MATNYTSYYQLNQWEPTDQVLHTDFNDDNQKIAAALHTLNTTVQQHTSQLSQQGTQISQKGDCTFYTTTYEGTGEDTRTLTFPQKPLLLFIFDQATGLAFILAEGVQSTAANGYPLKASWSGTTLTMTNTNTGVIPGFNYEFASYVVLALLRTGQ